MAAIPNTTQRFTDERPDRTSLATWLFVGAYMLLPFSTPAGESSSVVTFGLPFLVLGVGAMTLQTACAGFPIARVHFWAALFACLYAASTILFSFFAERPVVSLWRAMFNVLGLAIFLHMLQLAVLTAAKRKQAFLFMNRVLMLSGLVMGAYYLLNMLIVAMEHGLVAVFSERFVGGLIALPWGATNSIASALLMPLCASTIALNFPGEKKLASVALAIIITAILLTVSRNGIASMAVMVLIWALFYRRFFVLALAVVLAGASAWGLEQFEPGTLDFLYATRLENTTELYALNHRVDIWEESIGYLSSSPFKSIGYYGSLDKFDGLSGHNVPLTTILEQGIAGLLVFLGLWFCAFRSTLSGIRSSDATVQIFSKGMLAGLIGVIINQQFEDPNFTQQYISYFWLFMGLVFLGTKRS